MPQSDNSVAFTQKKVTFSSFLLGIVGGLRNLFSVSTFFVAFKYLAFLGFTGISAILSVNMFMRLSSAPVESFALVAVGVTLEFFKIFSIVRGNTLWRLKLKVQATRAYVMYTILAIVAVMASYGFTLTVINRNIQVNDSSTIQLQITNSQATQKEYNATLKSINSNIKANQDRLGVLPADFTSAAQSLNNTISKLQANEADLQAKLMSERANETTLRTQAIEATRQSTTTVSMFKLMANGFKWAVPSLDENSLMLFLLLAISIIIELGIISTSPAIPIDQKHLKHFLDEMSAHKAEELLAEVQGHKKKDQPRRQTFAGRMAQWWSNVKKDVDEVNHPPPKVEIAPAVLKMPKLLPTESTSIGSVPVRRHQEPIEPIKPWVPPKTVVNTIDHSEPLVQDTPPKEVVAPEPPKEVAAPAPTFPVSGEPPTDIPVRPTPPPSIRGSGATESPHEEPVVHTSPVAPQLVAEARIYRFGKTTEAVKDMFVAFTQKLFNNEGDPDAPLRSAENAAKLSGIAISLGSTFMNRLLEIKGSRGKALIEKREDGNLYPNYPEGYIISYATAEPSRERAK